MLFKDTLLAIREKIAISTRYRLRVLIRLRGLEILTTEAEETMEKDQNGWNSVVEELASGGALLLIY